MKTNSTKVMKQISFIKASEIDFVIIKINSNIIEVAIISIIRLVDYIMMVGYTIMMVGYCIMMVNYIMANYIVSCIKVIITNINLDLFISMGQLQVQLYYL